MWLYICGRVGVGFRVCGSRFYQMCWVLYWGCVLRVVFHTNCVAVEIFEKLAIVLNQSVFRSTRGNTRGNARVGKCGPDIDVGESTVVCVHRCA